MQNNTPTSVSIIIVNWNGLALLKKCLPSVVETEYANLEIVIADNASSDDSVSWIEDTYPDIKIVRHPENWAFCKGNNEAIPHASGEYILLLNNDVEVTKAWLTPLVSALDADETVAAVQPKLLQYTNRSLFEYAGGAGGFMDKYGYPFTRGRLFFTLEEDKGQYDDGMEIFWATGAAVLFRRSALEKVGYLDESFYMHMEEIDLCWRLKRAGYAIRVVPESIVYHIGGASLPYGDARKTYYNFRNSLIMLYKNLPPPIWRRRFAVRAMLDGVAMLRALLTGQFKEFSAIFRAYKDAHVMSKAYENDRPQHIDKNALPSYNGSIVLDYFLRGKKMFKQLRKEGFQARP
ncbi:MAG: glycosyltransferase family 2 protein [Rhodothermales bacterium]